MIPDDEAPVIFVDRAQSLNYDGPDLGEVFADAGTSIDLVNGTITSTGLFVDGTTGDVAIRGTVEAQAFVLLDGTTELGRLDELPSLNVALLGAGDMPSLALVHHAITGDPVSALQWSPTRRSWALGNADAYVAAEGYDINVSGKMRLEALSIDGSAHDVYVRLDAGQTAVTSAGDGYVTIGGNRIVLQGINPSSWIGDLDPAGVDLETIVGGTVGTLRVHNDKLQFLLTGTERLRASAAGLLVIPSVAGQIEVGNVFSGSWLGVESDNGYLLLGNGSSVDCYLRTSQPSSSLYLGADDANLLEIATGSQINCLVAGIRYPGTTVGGGTTNAIGIRWNNPNIVGAVDNSVSAVLGTVSDRRVKTDIAPLADGLGLVLALRPVDYQPVAVDLDPSADLTFGDPYGPRRSGLIADEVAELLPWAVVGDATPATLQSVDYPGLVPVLIAAVQQLADRVTALESTP